MLGTSTDVIGREEIPSRKYEIVLLIDHIRIRMFELACVNSCHRQLDLYYVFKESCERESCKRVHHVHRGRRRGETE